MSQPKLPPCGLYRTVKPLAGLEAGRLVYFHNHGDPGPGLYVPEKWDHNRAKFSPRGFTLPPDFDHRALRSLPAEGFYRVARKFVCCEKKCTTFEPDTFVQLGYNGVGKAIVFLPELGTGAIGIPDRGTAIDDAALDNLARLRVAERAAAPAAGGGAGGGDLSLPRGIIVH